LFLYIFLFIATLNTQISYLDLQPRVFRFVRI